MRRTLLRSAVPLALFVSLGGATLFAASTPSAAFSTRHENHENHVILIPQADKFIPYQMTIHAGDRVTWVNSDTDDHTVVSDAAFDSTGHRGFNQVVRGTDANHGRPGTLSLRFDEAGTFVYYCRFHARLDGNAQPVAPGPNGGIQDTHGNFGTPMSGVITVVASDNGDN